MKNKCLIGVHRCLSAAKLLFAASDFHSAVFLPASLAAPTSFVASVSSVLSGFDFGFSLGLRTTNGQNLHKPRRFSRTQGAETLPQRIAPLWPLPPLCPPVLTLFFSVSLRLCGEYSFGCGLPLCASVVNNELSPIELSVVNR
jgi:hypothetical protein